MAVTESAPHDLASRREALTARLRAWLTDRADNALAQRMASAAFLIRVASAGLAYLVQVLLARWMGTFEFGVYAYVLTWVMLVGGLVDLGLASASQRFIPDYTERGTLAHVRGFIYGSRWIAFGVATVFSVASVYGISLLEPWLDDYTIVPLYLGCAMLPIYGVMHCQDGIARSFNWVNIALIPSYILRQILLIVVMAAAVLAGFAANASTAIAAAGLTLWLTGFIQLILLNRKLATVEVASDRRYEPARWIVVALPMFIVDSLYLMLLYTDILVLKQFRSPEEIAVYYAATKTLSFVAFVHFAVAAATAHKYTEYHVSGDRDKLRRFLASSIRWTFWPSLAATLLILACGWPMLWLFGEQFVTGYKLMFILAIGMLARSAIGPGERFINMLGEQRACMVVVAVAVAVNLALCVVLIPTMGIEGAAIATSSAIVVESALLFVLARKRLGYHLFVWGGGRA